MAEMEDLIVQYNIENNPSYTMNMALFTDVTNSNELRQLIVQGSCPFKCVHGTVHIITKLILLFLYF